MNKPFDSIVRNIADEYVSSVLFVDEKAFSPSSSPEAKDKPTDLDVEAVSKAFTDAGKICGFFAPKSLDDIEKCKKLVLKPDIAILDWDIDIKNGRAITKEEENEDDVTDDRGYYSLELLKCIVNDATDAKLKVVFIYTGEPAINNIISNIAEAFGESFKKNEKKYEVNSNNVHIIVRLKPDTKVRLAGFDDFKVSYERLPDVVLNSFAEYVQGLMPCFAMSCLTKIRESAARVLRVYNKGLDPELLAHELSIPNPEDTKSYLSKSFGSAITDLITNDEAIDTDLWVEPWIESNYSDHPIPKDIAGKTIKVSKDSINKFFQNRIKKPKLSFRFNSAFGVSVEDEDLNNCIKNLSRVFHEDDSIIEQSRFEFASLQHRKNLFSLKASIPTLTLGSVVEKETGGYYICIQQRCDSVRIPKEGRDFLFLPLVDKKESNVICAISLSPGQCLYVPNKSYKLSIFTFKPDKNSKPIVAKKDNGSFYFISADEERFKWLADLNDLSAQRIVNDYTSHLSRVGLDEAEWLRVEGLN